ncbi:hypothetical protein GCM10011331_02470 [Flavimobilis marinus]|uniref:Lincosamide nucleotidyltransferase n=1 Tax=Flavimobilis marinus TaxID=285351 RepID=A0A1I2DW74_9MICO|nr:hypothetical protein [Flavimobilis marinus]GHG44219.1 hypothetical protein GCM10011331_02470 [Flavimobilis marinus]SFE84501.1 hypothetical protein SAMN04488035_0756 [Flavimobilis marinus]
MTTTTARAREEFDRFTQDLVTSASARDDVVGLVLLGSGADTARVDEWSDHDFYLVSTPGAQEALRTDLSWLPRSVSIVLAARETEHGLKVVYDDGHVLEFAVADLDEVRGFGTNHWRVVLDRGGVAEAVGSAALVTHARPGRPARDAVGLAVTLVLIAAGRARRGETLTAQRSVAQAVDLVLEAVTARIASADPAVTDVLDARRRAEAAYPDVAAALSQALMAAPEEGARRVLDAAEGALARGWDGWPHAAVAAVRRRLGWARPAPWARS